jgi:type I restriction enzyme M protein
MTEQDQKQLGTTLWGIADQLRGAMNADDFRDYMLSFLFLRYLSDNYETAAQKELGGPDYPKLDRRRPPHAAGGVVRAEPRRHRKNLKSRCAARRIT